MFFNKAFAQAEVEEISIIPDGALGGGGTEAFLLNLVPIVVLMGLFYVLLIMPQQKRMKEHAKMLDKLAKGDSVITGGGLVGKIDKIIDDKEVSINLGGDVKVVALRSTIQSKSENTKSEKAKPEKKEAKEKKSKDTKKDSKK